MKWKLATWRSRWARGGILTWPLAAPMPSCGLRRRRSVRCHSTNADFRDEIRPEISFLGIRSIQPELWDLGILTTCTAARTMVGCVRSPARTADGSSLKPTPTGVGCSCIRPMALILCALNQCWRRPRRCPMARHSSSRPVRCSKLPSPFVLRSDPRPPKDRWAESRNSR